MDFWAGLPKNEAADKLPPGEILTAAQMRALESAAMARGVTGGALMERAGQAVVDALLETWPRHAQADSRQPWRALVLCGPGNNGGDGYVVARLLSMRGWSVTVWTLGDADRLPPDARAAHARWLERGAVLPLPAPIPPIRADVVVDALFGTGLTRPIDPALAELLAAIDEARHRPGRGPHGQAIGNIVAIDIPSGLNADSGLVPGPDPHAFLPADLTVTFHAPKLGHVLGEGPAACGRLVVADIGLTGGAEGAARLVPAPRGLAKTGEHKYHHGHALILGGGAGRCGAARLAARGALRIGAGLVTLAPRPEAMAENAARLDAVMLAPVADAGDLAALLADRRLNAVVLGPGLGHDRARALVPAVLDSRRAAVLDADALSAFADDPAALLARLHPGAVLTPHEGEFARLFPALAARLPEPLDNRVEIVRQAAAQAGCTLLLKGPATVIAGPEGAASVHVAAYGWAAPWLATAGAGDVLAGMIGGLLARGFGPMRAAEAATWLHAAAARAFGPGLIAEDLPDALPGILATLPDA